MRRHALYRSTTLVLMGLLSGCFPSFWSRPADSTTPSLSRQGGIQVVKQGETTTIQRVDPVLVGRVGLGSGDLQVQATVADVANNATVALIDPASNVTIATSVTDGSGNFSLPLPTSWNPALGANFVVEAFKGLGGNAAGQNVIRLRSMIQKLAGPGNFTSVTGTDSIGVNPMTTAVYLKSMAGFGAIPVANTYFTDLRGTVTAAGALRQNNQFTTWNVTDVQLNNLNTMVTDTVTGNHDPVGTVNSQLAPVVSNFSAYTATVGSLIAINGTGFSPMLSGNTVTFNPAVAATVLYASKTQLIVAVPSGATTGNVTIATPIGATAGINFNVSPAVGSAAGAPVISNLDNPRPAPGNTLQLGGVNFVNGTNTVTFASGAGSTVDATATYVNAYQLSVTVPGSAKSGPLTVTNSNGTSNGFWLEVIHGSGTLVETFADASRRDGTATNVGQWVGGVSPVGAGTYLASSVAAFDAATQTNVQSLHDAASELYPASVRLALTDNPANFPIANNVAMPTDLYNNSNAGVATILATNGSRLLRGDAAANPLLTLLSNGFDGYAFASRNPAINLAVAGLTPTANYKMCGLVGSDNFFYLEETTPSFFGLSYFNVAVPSSTTTGTTAFYDTDGVNALGIYKIAPALLQGSSAYGSKLGSDGTYVYLLSGVGYVAGVPTYNNAINLYKFRPDSYASPTKLILAGILENITLPANKYFTQYTQLMVDKLAWYVPAAVSAYPDAMTAYSHRTGASKNIAVRFRNSDGQQGVVAYDSLHDVYFAGSYNNASWFRQYYVNPRVYETTGNLTTTTQTLPADMAWSQVQIVTDALPTGTNVTYDVLDGSGAPIAGYQGLAPGASLRGLVAPSLRIRVNLAGDGTTTPVVRAVNLLTIPTSPVARSTAYPIIGADANDRIVIDSLQYTHSTNGGSITYQFADSADNVSYSSFQDSFTAVSRRYLKWQIVPTVATSTNSAMVPPIVRRIQINYHY